MPPGVLYGCQVICSLSVPPSPWAADGVFLDLDVAMQDYEVFLLVNDDEFSLGTVGEIFDLEIATSLATLFADIIGGMAFETENQTTQELKIELRSPNGL